MEKSGRFPIQFDRWYALLSSSLFLFPSGAYVDVEGDRVSVRMGWAFRATFGRSDVGSVSRYRGNVSLTRGVHGWGGKWLVNGSGDGVVEIELVPAQRAYVMGVPVTLRELLVSVAEPAALIESLKPAT